MKKKLIVATIMLTSISLTAQEWDDPATTSDWNQLWKSSFIQSNNASNAPENSGWFWGVNMNHSSNSSTYRYNGQIAIKNDNDAPTMYFRSTNSNGSGIWAKVIRSYYNNSISGDLATTNSLRVIGDNLDGDNLSFLQNSGSLLVGWNRSGGHGETSFISNRSAGSQGGFEFRDLSNAGFESLLLKISGNGNIGIGTNSVDEKLHIKQVAANSVLKIENTGNGNASIIKFSRERQTGEDVTGGAIGLVSNTSSNWSQLFLNARSGSAEAGVDGSGTQVPFLTIGDGSSNNVSVGIGTSNPKNALDVVGTIRSTEVKVEATPWPDFVFSNDYNLPSLEEVEKYIAQNNHLPEIPSEAEVLEDGINLGEMNAKLLQKIEELTLYLIEQNKELKEQNREIKTMRSELDELKEGK